MTAHVACSSCGQKNVYTAAVCASCGARLTFSAAPAKPDGPVVWLGCLIPVAVIAFVIYNWESGPSEDGVSEGTAIAMAKIAVENRLRDPASAEFSGVFVASDNRVVCGQVNAANGFGGMTGSQRFAVTSGFAVLEEDGDFQGLWETHCRM